MITVEDLITKLNFLIESNYLKPSDIILIGGTGDKTTGTLSGVSMPKISKVTAKTFDNSKGHFQLMFMNKYNVMDCLPESKICPIGGTLMNHPIDHVIKLSDAHIKKSPHISINQID